jgi:hypothetical protein
VRTPLASAFHHCRQERAFAYLRGDAASQLWSRQAARGVLGASDRHPGGHMGSRACSVALDDNDAAVRSGACSSVAVLTFAGRFRATFTSTEFIYRRSGPTVRVRYSEIDRIEVTNATPVTKQAVGAFVVTRRGQRLPFWPKLFPREAVTRFFALGR